LACFQSQHFKCCGRWLAWEINDRYPLQFNRLTDNRRQIISQTFNEQR
jgi:hypothetical protein